MFERLVGEAYGGLVALLSALVVVAEPFLRVGTVRTRLWVHEVALLASRFSALFLKAHLRPLQSLSATHRQPVKPMAGRLILAQRRCRGTGLRWLGAQMRC